MPESNPTTSALSLALAKAVATGSGRVDCDSAQRLPGEFLAALAAIPVNSQVTLVDVSPESRWALHVLGLAKRFSIESPTQTNPADLPFTATIAAHGEVMISIKPGISASKIIADQVSHWWLQGISASAVTIDATQIEQMNSVVIAWLLQVAQSSKPAKTRLRRLRQQIQIQLKQLRLDQMMDLA